jgi:dTDP-4-dehydrorhamnose reductase
MRIFITAANGQLGTDACACFSKRHEVVAKSSKELDITDRESVMEAVLNAKPDVVLNTAAMTDVDGCEDNAKRAFEVNAAGTENVAGAAKLAGAAIVHISTDYVFDGEKSSAYSEEDPPNPVNVYGASKLEGERRAAAVNPEHFILRTAWLYGAHGRNFVKTMLMLGKEKGEVRVVADQCGNPTSTLELLRMIEAVTAGGKFGVYHASCGGACSRSDLARAVFRRAGLEVKVFDVTSDQFSRKARRPANTDLSKEKLFICCGFRPAGWEAALEEFFSRNAVLT